MNTLYLLETSINGWLAAEEALASRPKTDNNRSAYLNDFNAVLKGLFSPPTETSNIFGQKGMGHIQRFSPNNPFWAWFEAEPVKDAAAGKMAFAALMKLSGCRRKLAYLNASDAENYQILRSDLATTPTKFIAGRAEKILGQSYVSDSEIDGLIHRDNVSVPFLREVANDIMTSALNADQEMHNWASNPSPKDVATITEDAVMAEQNHCVDFLIGITALGASLRGGDIARAPVLEPRSITLDPAVIYPFVEGFWDHYVPTPLPALD